MPPCHAPVIRLTALWRAVIPRSPMTLRWIVRLTVPTASARARWGCVPGSGNRHRQRAPPSAIKDRDRMNRRSTAPVRGSKELVVIAGEENVYAIFGRPYCPPETIFITGDQTV